MFFSRQEKSSAHSKKSGVFDFEYLDPAALYFDSACQTLRPESVIAAQNEYFHEYNACGGRGKYAWAERLDGKTVQVRAAMLKFLKKTERDYAVAFTLNTTYGINLLLQQLPEGKFSRIITSEIEHNSVFLPTITAAKRLGIPRLVLPRSADGSLEYAENDLERAVVVVNTTSNIDGRSLANIKELTAAVHKRGGIIILDAAQTCGHEPELLHGAEYDALCTSGHKMYGPSIGVIVLKKEFLEELPISLIGGGTVEDVEKDSYTLLGGDDAFARLELGLQNFSGIVGLGAALSWLEEYKPEGTSSKTHETELSKLLFNGMKKNPELTVINNAPSATVSVYSDKVDAHRLGLFLAAENIMVRSGYFCCHYYLKNLKKYPPLARFSLGLYNTKTQVEKVLATLQKILKNI